jgi:hypothetical protein
LPRARGSRPPTSSSSPSDGGTNVDRGASPGTFGGDDSGTSNQPCQSNPSFFDVPGDNCDNDGDGKIDNVATCDTGGSGGGDAMDFARALGLCQTASKADTKWGVISATFTAGHKSATPPNAEQHNIVSKFGAVVKAREGATFGVISSGSATEEDSDNGPQFKGQKKSMQGADQNDDAPPGYPKVSADCGGDDTSPTLVRDVVNVKLEIRVPANAQGFSFDFDFWSGEWPEFVCSGYNDAFIAYLSSQAYNGGTPENISFDGKNNPVSVNNGFFDRCTPNTKTGCLGLKQETASCPGGISELTGTGFADEGTWCNGTTSTGGGATGWLSSKAPVKPGEVITLELMIWDTGDASWDSTVLLDNFLWSPGPVSTGTTRPPPK